MVCFLNQCVGYAFEKKFTGNLAVVEIKSMLKRAGPESV